MTALNHFSLQNTLTVAEGSPEFWQVMEIEKEPKKTKQLMKLTNFVKSLNRSQRYCGELHRDGFIHQDRQEHKQEERKERVCLIK